MPASTTQQLANQVQQLANQFAMHKHTGADSQLISENAGSTLSGYMQIATYDPADVSEQLVGTTASQTLTNKTFTSPTVNGGTISQATLDSNIPTTAASTGASGTTTFNLQNGNVQNFTFSGSSASDSVTFALSNVTTNQIFIVSVTQNSGGSGTVTFWSTIRWAGGAAPTLTTTASARDTFGFIATSTSTFDGFIIGLDL